MFVRTMQSLALSCLFIASLSAADDPFVGKWKLNQDKSKIAGEQMKIQDLGDNKYKFSFGNVSDTITADGTDQPSISKEPCPSPKRDLTAGRWSLRRTAKSSV